MQKSEVFTRTELSTLSYYQLNILVALPIGSLFYCM